MNLNVDWERMRKRLGDYCKGFNINFDQSKNTFEGSKIAGKLFFKRSGDKKLADGFYANLIEIMKDEEILSIKNAKPMDGAKNFLEWIRKRGVKFIVFSYNHRRCIIETFKKFGFPPPEIIVGCDDLEYKYIKPDTRGLKKKLAKIKYDRAVVIGDSESDLAAGESLGLKVYILKLYDGQNGIDDKKRFISAKNFSELKKILLKDFLNN